MPLFGPLQAGATEMVYAPINPSFGGHPNNAPGLMSIAQAQNGFKAPIATPLETFNLNLQRAIMSRLTSQAMIAIFGTDTTVVSKSYDTGAYTIAMNEDTTTNTLTITTTDKTSGAVASFEISTLHPAP